MLPSSRSAGVTLLELMVTLAVLAILTTLALPSFQGIIRANRVATATNEMLASLSLARSQAIRSTQGAGVCASKNGSACDGENWGEGWLVWADDDGDGALNGAEVILKFSQARTGLVGDSGNKTIAFDGRGRSRAFNTQSIVLRAEECGSAELQRSLSVSVTGQVSVKQELCS